MICYYIYAHAHTHTYICVHAFVRACVRACVHGYLYAFTKKHSRPFSKPIGNTRSSFEQKPVLRLTLSSVSPPTSYLIYQAVIIPLMRLIYYLFLFPTIVSSQTNTIAASRHSTVHIMIKQKATFIECHKRLSIVTIASSMNNLPIII